MFSRYQTGRALLPRPLHRAIFQLLRFGPHGDAGGDPFAVVVLADESVAGSFGGFAEDAREGVQLIEAAGASEGHVMVGAALACKVKGADETCGRGHVNKGHGGLGKRRGVAVNSKGRRCQMNGNAATKAAGDGPKSRFVAFQIIRF